MKKIIIRVGIVLVVLLVLLVVAVGLFLDSGIKRGILAVAPMVTKVDVKLDGVSLSLLSGSGKISGFVLGNPEGFKTPSSIQVGTASLQVSPGSLLSDKVVIRSVDVQHPEITFETDLRANNLSKLLANIQAATGGSGTAAKTEPAKESKPAKKLEVDDFRITGAKLNVSVTAMGGKSVTVPLPEIHITDLGKGPDGITAGELAERVISAIEKEAVKASGSAIADLTKDASGLVKQATGDASGAAQKVTEGLGGLFKKK